MKKRKLYQHWECAYLLVSCHKIHSTLLSYGYQSQRNKMDFSWLDVNYNSTKRCYFKIWYQSKHNKMDFSWLDVNYNSTKKCYFKKWYLSERNKMDFSWLDVNYNATKRRYFKNDFIINVTKLIVVEWMSINYKEPKKLCQKLAWSQYRQI